MKPLGSVASTQGHTYQVLYEGQEASMRAWEVGQVSPAGDKGTGVELGLGSVQRQCTGWVPHQGPWEGCWFCEPEKGKAGMGRGVQIHMGASSCACFAVLPQLTFLKNIF